MPHSLTKEGDLLVIKLEGRWSDISDAKDKVREIPGRRWDPDNSVWTVPAEPQTADRILKSIHPDASEELLGWVRESMTDHEESLTSPLPEDGTLLIPWATQRMPWQPEFVNDVEFNGALDYQRAAIEAMADEGRVLLCDDMGLGKTFEIISAAAERLLRCSYEAGSLITLGGKESRGTSTALSSLLSTLQGEDICADPQREVEALHGLWSDLATGSDGPGSCNGGQVVCARALDEAAGSAWAIARSGSLGRDFQVRGSLPELSPDATLALGPKLVIAPASVLGGWNRELNRWLEDPAVQIVDGNTPKARHAQVQQGIKDDAWVIVNWEQIRVKKLEVRRKNGSKVKLTVMKEPLFQYPQAAAWDLSIDEWGPTEYGRADRQFRKAPPGWLVVAADEIHRAKNKDAQQTRGLHRIRGWSMYGASGTPMMNSPDELWSLLAWLWPDEYHKDGAQHAPGAQAYWPFYLTYVDFWEDHRGRKVVTGVKNPDALRHILRGKLIRRTASLLGLKGRRRFFYPVPLTSIQQKIYKEAETAMWLAVEKEAVAGNKDAIQFARAAAEGASMVELTRIPNGAARFVHLQKIIENAALMGGPDSSANMDDFEQKFADSRPEPWVVFCKYKETCEILSERLRRKFDAKVEIYNGDVHPRDRTEIEDSFQRGEVDVIVGTVAAMYQGITLTRGHLQYWVSREVVPAINEQGESRQDRQGQQELVRIYIPQAEGTVAAGKVHVINRLKEKIVKTVLPQDTIQEATA